jgi:hypothetical protein
MEYYDSLDKQEFYEFYFVKSKKLYFNPLVIELLDGESFTDMNLFNSNTFESPVKKKLTYNYEHECRSNFRTKSVSHIKVFSTNTAC